MYKRFLFFSLCLYFISERTLAQLSKAEYYNKIDNAMFVLSKMYPHLAEDSLVLFVNRKYTSNEDKVRAYSTWIALNVHYDMDRFRDFSYMKLMNFRNASDLSQNADTVFRRRMAVCEGFSKLMNKLCNASGIPSFMVVGYTRMPDEDEVVTDILHAWNAVKVDSTWQLIDITWSNGYVHPVKGYVHRFSDKYFMTKPAVFALDHWPLDAMWQLQEYPVSRKHFFKSDSADVPGPAYHFNDSIRRYMGSSEDGRRFIDFEHYHANEPGNSSYIQTLDIMVNNEAAELLMSASLYYEEFVDFYNKTLSKQMTAGNLKKGKGILEEARTYNNKAIEALKHRKAYTAQYQAIFDDMIKSTETNNKTITDGMSYLNSMQKQLKTTKAK